jgi:hypothetical protein
MTQTAFAPGTVITNHNRLWRVAAQALHPKDEAAAQRWNMKRRRDLYRGTIHHITTPLDNAGLQSHAQCSMLPCPQTPYAMPGVPRTGLSYRFRHSRKWHQAIQSPPHRSRYALVTPCRRAYACHPCRRHDRQLRPTLGTRPKLTNRVKCTLLPPEFVKQLCSNYNLVSSNKGLLSFSTTFLTFLSFFWRRSSEARAGDS